MDEDIDADERLPEESAELWEFDSLSESSESTTSSGSDDDPGHSDASEGEQDHVFAGTFPDNLDPLWTDLVGCKGIWISE